MLADAGVTVTVGVAGVAGGVEPPPLHASTEKTIAIRREAGNIRANRFIQYSSKLITCYRKDFRDAAGKVDWSIPIYAPISPARCRCFSSGESLRLPRRCRSQQPCPSPEGRASGHSTSPTAVGSIVLASPSQGTPCKHRWRGSRFDAPRGDRRRLVGGVSPAISRELPGAREEAWCRRTDCSPSDPAARNPRSRR